MSSATQVAEYPQQHQNMINRRNSPVRPMYFQNPLVLKEKLNKN